MKINLDNISINKFSFGNPKKIMDAYGNYRIKADLYYDDALVGDYDPHYTSNPLEDNPYPFIRFSDDVIERGEDKKIFERYSKYTSYFEFPKDGSNAGFDILLFDLEQLYEIAININNLDKNHEADGIGIVNGCEPGCLKTVLRLMKSFKESEEDDDPWTKEKVIERLGDGLRF